MDKALRAAGFVEKFFHTGDVRLNYVAGPDNGDPLVFIHGQAVTWEEYTYVLPILARHFQVYAVTLRGHGRSSWVPGTYTFNQLGVDMTAFLRDVVGRPAVVAGNSSGGVLTAWLAANSAEWVRAIVLEDPPLFRCEWPNIKNTAVYDTWLAIARTTVPASGGFAGFFRDHLVPNLGSAGGVMNAKTPPGFALKTIARMVSVKQALAPGRPVDFRFAPPTMRITLRGISQFDGNFAKAFVDGSVGTGFDHAETLTRIAQPVLFLHARYFTGEDGRLVGALDDDDVARVQSLVAGSWTYVRMDCGHAIALDAPNREIEEVTRWFEEVVQATS